MFGCSPFGIPRASRLYALKIRTMRHEVSTELEATSSHKRRTFKLGKRVIVIRTPLLPSLAIFQHALETFELTDSTILDKEFRSRGNGYVK
jgi:hypothetical protein